MSVQKNLCQFVLYLVGNCINLYHFGEGFLLVSNSPKMTLQTSSQHQKHHQPLESHKASIHNWLKKPAQISVRPHYKHRSLRALTFQIASNMDCMVFSKTAVTTTIPVFRTGISLALRTQFLKSSCTCKPKYVKPYQQRQAPRWITYDKQNMSIFEGMKFQLEKGIPIFTDGKFRIA
jgi:hypothetical protein